MDDFNQVLSDGEALQINCVISAVTDDERRAVADAEVREIAAGTLIVTPSRLREVAGPEISWISPRRGEAIASLTPVRNLKEANDLLRWWACKTVTECASSYR